MQKSLPGESFIKVHVHVHVWTVVQEQIRGQTDRQLCFIHIKIV